MLGVFAPAELSTYGGEQVANEGYFFQFDALFWSISPPKINDVAAPGKRIVYYGIHPTSDQDPLSYERVRLNMSLRRDLEANSAQRLFEFGRIDDGVGWFVSIWHFRDQSQTIKAQWRHGFQRPGGRIPQHAPAHGQR